MNNSFIEQELLQYVAKLIEKHPLQNHDNKKAVRHDVSALLVQQALDLSKEEHEYDLFIAKPILKATLLILKQRCQSLEPLKQESAFQNLYQDTLQMINSLESILNHIAN